MNTQLRHCCLKYWLPCLDSSFQLHLLFFMVKLCCPLEAIFQHYLISIFVIFIFFIYMPVLLNLVLTLMQHKFWFVRLCIIIKDSGKIQNKTKGVQLIREQNRHYVHVSCYALIFVVYLSGTCTHCMTCRYIVTHILKILEIKFDLLR